MKILVCALVGLIIFVSQPNTVIVVGDFPLQGAENRNHAALAGMSSGDGGGLSLDKLIVLRESLEASTLANTTRVQLVGPKRGPVK
jgi:hypothetical protein